MKNQMIFMKNTAFSIFILLCILIGPVRVGVTQNLSPITEDRRVDESPPISMGAYEPAIAYNPKSLVYMIAWADEVSAGIRKIYGRIFDPSGFPMTQEFKIDESAEQVEGCGQVDIAVDAFDNFWVVWEDRRNYPDYQIYLRIFSSVGEPLTKETAIENARDDTSSLRQPAIAISPQNVALIAWVNDSNGQQSIQCRFIQIQASGEFTFGDDLVVNPNNARNSRTANRPRIAVTSAGDFVITWRDNRYETQPNQGLDLIYARRYHYSSEALGPEFLVNEYVPETPVNYSDPDVTIDRNDNMIFTWNDGRYFLNQSTYYTYFRKFSWDETPLTGDVQVDSCNSLDHPRIATDQQNRFIIIYSRRSISSADPDTAFDHLYAKRYSDTNQSIDNEWTIDQGGTVQYNTEHAHIINTVNLLITTWTTNHLTMPQETFTGSVYMNIYGIPLPSSPSNLKAEQVDTNKILWTWIDNSDDETYFRMRDENNLAISPFLSPNTQSWEETGLAPNLRVNRTIVAGNSSGESGPSNLVSVFTLAIAPTNLRVDSTTDKKVELVWDGDNPTRYAVEKALDNNGQPGNFEFVVSWDDSLTQNTFTDIEIEPATAYWYRVRGYNGDQLLTTATNAVQAVTGDSVITHPTDFEGTSTSPTTVLWRWKGNSNDWNNFFIEDSAGQLISDYLPANTTSWLETGLQPNTIYRRRVRAVSTTGIMSEASNLYAVCTLANPPSSLVISEISSNSIVLTWQGNATRFAIDRAPDIGGNPGEWTVLIEWESNWTTTRYEDTNLEANTTYWYQVRSYNQLGTMNENSAMIQSTTPAFIGPTNFRGIALSTSSILWTWQHDTQDQIFYIVSSENEITLSPSLPVDTKSWTETALDSNTQYIRFVQAVDTDTIHCSNLDSVYTLAKIPTDLNVTRFQDKAHLVWNGQGGTRFAIQRAIGADTFSLEWEFVAQWEHNVTESFFEDDSLDSTLSYWYRIQAYNGDRIPSEPSEPFLADPIQTVVRKGDVNNDGQIDLIDLDRLVQIILEQGTPIKPTEIYPADCYEDSQTNIHDIIWLVNAILRIPMSTDNAAFSTAHENDAIEIVETMLLPAQESRVPIILKNSVSIKALQLQFEIDHKVKLGNVRLTAPTHGMTLSSWQTEQQLRLVIYNMNNAAYAPGEADLLTLVLTPESTTDEAIDIVISGAMALDARGNPIRLLTSMNQLYVAQEQIPVQFVLNQNYPNPFNSTTEISFQCPENTAEVTLKIFDLMGHEIVALLKNRPSAGIIRVHWDGKDKLGRNVSSGLYFYQLDTPGFHSTKKLMLVR